MNNISEIHDDNKMYKIEAFLKMSLFYVVERCSLVVAYRRFRCCKFHTRRRENLISHINVSDFSFFLRLWDVSHFKDEELRGLIGSAFGGARAHVMWE
jgi:hypothetical protein